MSEQVIRFCTVCDNRYYHQVEDDSMVYFCRICGNKDENLSNESLCVLNIQYGQPQQNMEQFVNKFTKFDPTLPHIYVCCPNEKCKSHKESDDKSDVVFIRYDKENMKHLYLCTICDFVWKSNS